MEAGLEFTTVNNAEHAPEISNELVTIWMEDFDCGLDRNRSIELTRNFCNWLYLNG